MQNDHHQATFLGHPRGLFLLFFVEMWERFSYYGMRALLVFYMTKGFMKLDDARAYGIYGAYTALVYATPFVGGMLADRLLGQRRAVILGGLLMAAGHLLMTVEHTAAFSTALALLIAGNGFFKPNISTMVGSLYGDGSPKRDSGFTIFYMGINLGAALAPLVCGYVGETYGWHYGFGLATLGMLLGLGLFVARGRLDGGVGEPPRGADSSPVFLGLDGFQAVSLGTAVAIPLFALLVQATSLAGIVLAVFGGAALLKLVYDSFQVDADERRRLWVVLVLMFFSMLFWAFFEQAGSSLNNFADRNVNRLVLGREVPASIFQAANPVYILAFGLLFSMLWGFLGRRGLDPPAPIKFSMGLAQLGLGFAAIWLGARTDATDGMVPLWWLLLAYLLHTTGELCLSPVGLSMVTRLSPARMVSTVMGAWFLATAFSNYLAGMIAALTGAGHGGAEDGLVPPPVETVGIYAGVFGTIAVTSLASAAVLLALSPLLIRWETSSSPCRR